MGRSKSTPSPALKKSMPQNITPKQSLEKNTPGKSATKRPLPQDSDSEDEDLELLPQNGFLKSKKGKFTVPDDDVSADDVSGEGSDDSEEEESSAEEEDLEGDQEEDDDDDDDEEDDEDGDDDDDDESGSDDEPTQNTPSQEAMNKQSPVVATQSATLSTQAPTDTLKKSVPSKSTGPLTHLLIPNPPRQLSQLRTVLSDRGYSVNSLTSLQLHVAFVNLHPNEDLKSLVSGEKPLSVDGKTVNFIHLEGSPDAIDLLTPEINDSLFLSFPKFVTMEMIVSKLPANCRPTSTKLLSNSGRQQMFSAAILTFSSTCDASAALAALSDVKFGGRTIRVGYLRPRSESKTDSTSSAPESEIRVLNAPKDATIDDMLSLFPGATEARAAQGCFIVNFPDVTTRRKAVLGEKALKGKVLQITIPGGLDGNFRLIKNIPFDASESELRKAYSEATKITLNRREDGAFNGSALLEFASAASAQAAVIKNVTMKGRRLFAVCSHVEISAAKPAKKQPMKSESHKVPNKAEAPPQVGSASESDDEEVEERIKPGPQSSQRPSAKAKEEEDEDEDDDDEADEDEEDEDDDDEEEDEDDDDDDDEEEEQESADSGEEGADEEMPLDNSRDKGSFHPSKPQFKGPGFKNRGTPTGGNRGGRGFSPRGGRGFGGDRGHRGGHRGGGRGRGRGRGGFHRGRGHNKRG